ncbi:hypothetical protein [Staphylococcus aureus]
MPTTFGGEPFKLSFI